MTLTHPSVAAAPPRAAAPTSFMPPGLLPVAAAIFFAGGIGPNSDLAVLAVAELVVGAILLWRPGESPILLFIFAWQWLQASIGIFHANWLGLNIAAYSRVGGYPEQAVVLTLLGLGFLAVGMRLGAGGKSPLDAAQSRAVAIATPTQQWFWLYAYAAGVAFVALTLSESLPVLSQGFLALASLKWAFFYMVAYASMCRGAGDRKYFVIAFALEFVQGFGGYFSDFKTVLFVSLMAVAASGARVSVAAMVSFGLLSALTVVAGVVWTGIKEEYRTYVSGGRQNQTVIVDYGDRVQKLFELVGKLDDTMIQRSTEVMLRRVSYVDFFGAVISTVPLSVPYQEGGIWFDAVARPFMPRILFPDKAAIRDTDRTNEFTGGLAGNYYGTSISLGYAAESYIDFGPIGMMIPIFLYGMFCGNVFRRFLKWRASSGLLGMGMATSVLLTTMFLESSITKVFGGLMVNILVAWLFVLFVTPRWFSWLRAREA